MNDKLHLADAARLDAELMAATTGADDQQILARARTRVSAEVARRPSSSRPWVIALAAGLPAAAAAVLALALVGNLGHPVANHAVTGPAPSPSSSLEPAPSPVPLPPLLRIEMMSTTVGWAIIGPEGLAPGSAAPRRVGRTDDGGRTWKLVLKPSSGQIVSSFFLDAGIAWVVTQAYPPPGGPHQATAYRTADGGKTWLSSTFTITGSPDDLDRSDGMAGLSVVDATHGWLTAATGAAAGSSGLNLYRSIDGGAGWTLVASATPGDANSAAPGHMPGGCVKNRVSFASANTGFLTATCNGGDAFLWASQDGGGTWVQQRVPLPDLSSGYVTNCMCQTYPPTFTGGPFGWMVLHGVVEGGPIDTLYTSDDGGRTWKGRRLPGLPLSTISVQHAATAFVLAAPDDGGSHSTGTLYASADGGISWHPTTSQPAGGFGTPDFVSDRFGWVLQNYGCPSYPCSTELVQTVNGGLTWTYPHYRIVP